MIFFVWSLLLSAVQYARRHRLNSILSQYFLTQYSQKTMLVFRKTSSLSVAARNISRRLEYGNTALWKMNSEPCLPYDSEASILYRNEQLEIVVQPTALDFHISDWQIIAQPPRRYSTRISFIASLGCVTTNNKNNGEVEEDALSSMNVLINDNSLVAASQKQLNDFNHFEPFLIRQLCKKLGHHRSRPWEILYDCELEDFYAIAFAWIENSLLDIGGKARVKTIKTIHFSEIFLSPVDRSNQWYTFRGLDASLNSLSSSQPLTLLEALYLSNDEFETGTVGSSTPFNLNVSKFHSDTALNGEHIRPVSITNRLSYKPLELSSVRASRNVDRGPALDTFRYRTYSLPPLRALFLAGDPPPAFFKYLGEHDFFTIPASATTRRSISTSTNLSPLSPSNTFGDFTEIEEHCNELHQHSVAGSGKNLTIPNSDENLTIEEAKSLSLRSLHSSPTTKLSKSTIPSRFTMSIVHEDEFLNHTARDDEKSEENRGTKKRKKQKSVFHFEKMSGKSNEEIVDKKSLDYKKNIMEKEAEKSETSLPLNYSLNTGNSKFAAKTRIHENRRHSAVPFINIYAGGPPIGIRRRSLSPMAFLPIPVLSDSLSPLFDPEAFHHRSVTPTRRRLFNDASLDKVQSKPPTILVFTGDNDELYHRIHSTLSTMVSPEIYTVFHLSVEALHHHPWINREAVCLIIADTKCLDDVAWLRLQQYFNNSGKMLFLCQNNLLASLSTCGSFHESAKLLKMAFGDRQSNVLGKDFENFIKKAFKSISKYKTVNETFHSKDLVGGLKYSVVIYKNADAPLLLYMENAAHHASALFSDATSEELFESGATLIADALSRLSVQISPKVVIPNLSQGYLICQYDRLPWNIKGMYFNEVFGSFPKLLIKQIEKDGKLPAATNQLLPIEVRTRQQGLPEFDDRMYFRTLRTKRIGAALIYVPVCESTQDIAKSLATAMPNEPIVVVARQQTKGRGRSGNQWLSPIGCAVFSFNFNLPASTLLASNVVFIQYIFSVAIVDGICSLHPHLENLQLKIKWPNDIYYGRMYKMGGLLVNASTIGDKTVCTLGAGFNVANSKPTICVNDVLPINSRIEVKIEEFIANALNKFEDYVNIFQTNGRQDFLKYYYNFWLHSREEVTLAKSNEKVVIRGLDEHGFLVVRSRQSGKIMVVHPDGNTFDMMKGLISVKY